MTERKKISASVSIAIGTLFTIRDNIEVYFIHIVYTEKMDSTIIVYIALTKQRVRWNNYRKKFITGCIWANGT